MAKLSIAKLCAQREARSSTDGFRMVSSKNGTALLEMGARLAGTTRTVSMIEFCRELKDAHMKNICLLILLTLSACGAERSTDPTAVTREDLRHQAQQISDFRDERQRLDQQRRRLASLSRLERGARDEDNPSQDIEAEIRSLDKSIAELDRTLRGREILWLLEGRGALLGAGAVAGMVPAMPEPTLPWPLPEPSARAVLPDALQPSRSLIELNLLMVANRLEHALREAGYSENGFYNIPGGFALVTRIERIREDGKPASQRFLPPNEREAHTLISSLDRLFGSAPAGRYRLVMLVVTDQPIAGLGPHLEINAAARLQGRGAIDLIGERRGRDFGPNSRIAVFVYEYRRDRRGQEAFLIIPGRWPIDHHLQATGLASSLRVVH